MQVVRAGEAATDAGGQGMAAQWLAGPHQNERLDVGLVSFDPGAATPPHVHHVGQVLVVASGTGYVETAGERVDVTVGDVVVTPAGEWHVHGAAAGGPMTHLSVTTGTNAVRLDADGTS
jgi:quercetin dioxygenase-like cupin family protein